MQSMVTLGQVGQLMSLGIHVETMLSLRKAYATLRQRYVLDSRTSGFNGFEVIILMSSDEPLSAKGLSDLLSCKPAQITGYVSRLETLGLLKRKISLSDKRSFKFQLTKKGKQKAAVLLDISRDIFQTTTKLTGPENIELIKLLQKI